MNLVAGSYTGFNKCSNIWGLDLLEQLLKKTWHGVKPFNILKPSGLEDTEELIHIQNQVIYLVFSRSEE